MMQRASLVFITFVLVHFAWAASYDPLVVDPNFHPKVRDLTVHDAARNRDLPVRVYLPPNDKPAPVVLFSHGLGGSRKGSKFLGERWAARGYFVVFVQHPGSGEFVRCSINSKPGTERSACEPNGFDADRDVRPFVRRGYDPGGNRRDVPNEWHRTDRSKDSRRGHHESEHAEIRNGGSAPSAM